MQVRLIDEAKSELKISDDPSWALFGELAAAIQRTLGGQWIERLDAVDQRYWDLQVEDAVVTLHMEHYLGISLLPSGAASSKQASSALVRRISTFLATYQPAA